MPRPRRPAIAHGTTMARSRRHTLSPIAAAIATTTLLATTHAWAQTPASAAAPPGASASAAAATAATASQLPAVTVTGRASPPASIAGWGDIPLAKTPVQASVYTAEHLRDTGATRLSNITSLDPA